MPSPRDQSPRLQSSALQSVGVGAAAGFLATVPMTAFMGLAIRGLRRQERYPLPPWQITMRLAQTTGAARRMNWRERVAATGVAHFGYGAAMGAAYGLGVPPAWRHPTTGMAWGLAVWAGSYLGLLPALRVLRPATQHPPRRTALMIGAHLVWGAALGFLSARMRMDQCSPIRSRIVRVKVRRPARSPHVSPPI